MIYLCSSGQLQFFTESSVNLYRRNSNITAIVLGSALALVVAYHMVTDEILLHSMTFVASVFVIGFRTIQLIHDWFPAISVARKQIWGMVRFGAGKISLGTSYCILPHLLRLLANSHFPSRVCRLNSWRMGLWLLEKFSESYRIALGVSTRATWMVSIRLLSTSHFTSKEALDNC